MKLLRDQVSKVNILTESVTNEQGRKEPQYYLEGVFLQTNIKNRNGRIYPMEIVKPEVERYIAEYVVNGRAFGQLGHPTDPNETPNINLKEVSHVITKIWQDGDYFKARAKILDTPNGKVVKEMIRQHCQLGVSSRAMGSVTERDGVQYVNDDFHLITAGDIVFEPSAQSAFPVGLIEEIEWDYDPVTGQYFRKDTPNGLKNFDESAKLKTLQDFFKSLTEKIC